MSDIEKRLNNIEAHLSINQTITRYCRSLDWLDEELLRTCYTQDAYIDYGFYKGDVQGFYPVVMEVERQSMHRYHFLSNVAIEVDGENAEGQEDHSQQAQQHATGGPGTGTNRLHTLLPPVIRMSDGNSKYRKAMTRTCAHTQ